MHFHQNHCWCLRSHWDSDIFDATYMVAIEKFLYTDNDHVVDQDWQELIQHEKIIDSFMLEANKKTFAKIASENNTPMISQEKLEKISSRPVPKLRDDVVEWLYENIQPQRGNPGWCMGDLEYRKTGSSLDLTIWFVRRSDAMRFIRTWSVYQKPTTYFNYFRDDSRELKNGKLVKKIRS